jgi:hypothetical protein
MNNYILTTNFTCQSCGNGSYSTGGNSSVCINCTANCTTCNSTSCIACNANFSLINGTQCVAC